VSLEARRVLVRNNKMYLSIGTLAVAMILGLTILWQTNENPRTDDASVRANYVQFTPEVNGRVIKIPVKDNAYVHSGDVLFMIDPRPYQYALNEALSNQKLLEEQIVDTQRRIAAQESAVSAARASVRASQTQTHTAESTVEGASASTERAKAAVASAKAQKLLADNNLHRLEPLLPKQFVTREQIDEARTKAQVAEHNLEEVEAALQQTIAHERQVKSQKQEADTSVAISEAKLLQSISSIDRLETLVSQREAKAAKVASAKLDLERCTVVAPFDGYVTNLNISEGEYAKPGVPIFTLIDTRSWWVVGNYRESDLKAISKGKHVDVYLMGSPSRKFDGIVESIGFGVAPDDAALQAGLPRIEHTLNWVHLAARFPVRIRVQNPDPVLFRVGETAITIVR